MVSLNRRQFLGLTALGLTGAVSWQTWRTQQAGNSVNAVNAPAVYKSEGGLLEVELEAQYADVMLGGQAARDMMTYNGLIPAPRFEVKAGDRLRIQFKNSLDQPTNLHFHGLHLSPEGNQDNVFLHIKPNETFTYELDIHPDQRAGTYWYHPHIHGFVAEQLFKGLAGLIIVRGDLDDIPEIAAAQEEFLVLQDFALDERGGMMGNNQMNLMAGREGNLLTVNGLYDPTIKPTKDLLRLRLLNASPSRFYRMKIEGQKLTQIATDGGALGQPIQIDELLLTPGQRAEVLIATKDLPQIPVHLLSLPYQRGNMGMMGSQSRSSIQSLMNFAPADFQPNAVEIPTQLVAIEPLPEPTKTRKFTLNHGMVPGQGMAFLINGESYQDRPQTTVDLDTVEEWELVNTGTMEHPFHVHVNKFQVVSRDGVPEPNLAWRDTVLVRVGETVRIRMAFKDFAGKTVYHCHILDHEDLGMMGQLEILPAGETS